MSQFFHSQTLRDTTKNENKRTQAEVPRPRQRGSQPTAVRTHAEVRSN